MDQTDRTDADGRGDGLPNVDPEPQPQNPTDGRGDGPDDIDKTVAFTAKLIPCDNYPAHNGVLKFRHILVNKREGYDATTGVFTCPMAGFYYFTVHASVYGRGEVIIQKNGVKVVSAYHTTLPNRMSQVASISSVIKLSLGDRVWVDLWGCGRNDIFCSADNDTVFVGFRLS
ncbi:complement C1q and tumor necrosis factor-related protein 9B-like [Alosa sapidissima]|uniref:complement C1q and tumor necrosis factor-related protein 9B-like n=2 Tax=Alosa TaxID=34772 RepID=UPI001C0A09F4|nr:complement C1q and tumor necrosis factor-related protein 9B-like [Alosa sapidissima]